MDIKFKTDENMPHGAISLLRSAGYNAMSVYEQSLVGYKDRAIADICRKENRVIITLDLDFSDIRTYPPNQYDGIIVLRIHDQCKRSVLALLRRVLQFLKDNPCRNQLWLVEEDRIRIRS